MVFFFLNFHSLTEIYIEIFTKEMTRQELLQNNLGKLQYSAGIRTDTQINETVLIIQK